MKHTKLILDNNRRQLFTKLELYYKVLSTLFIYSKDNYFKLMILKKKNTKWTTHSCLTRVKNYCIISGRSKNINIKYKVSRIIFKEIAIKGLWFGLKKIT
jgi:ribosomal protein S14